MDEANYQALLPHLLRVKGRAVISVTGYSMNPLIHEGDRITVVPADNVRIGDILVFPYYREIPTVHRLLRKDTLLHCKGDNTFRLESIPPERVIGKVAQVNGVPPEPWQNWKIALSYEVYRTFHELGDDIGKAKQTDLWRFYAHMILKREDDHMFYCKNDTMDFIETDETSLAVFDPESGDTHFYNESGMDILKCITDPCDLDTLLARLCGLYEAAPDDIREDVIEFLADCIAKKVVLLK